MNKFSFSLLSALLIITACQRDSVYNTHGIAYLEKREKLITINESIKIDSDNQYYINQKNKFIELIN